MKVCPVCGTEYGEADAFCSRDRSPLRPAAGGGTHGLVGQLVGERYQIERRLGQGGMGEVYLARHVLIGRACALKVMSQALSKDPDAVTRFNREATNASRITHPNVCAIYDFGLTSEGLVYLAMEYVEGRTLSALLEQSGPVPVPRAAALVAQCAAGLQAAHEMGIVHRDLKPDNIMVVESRERETAKLVDFGIAKAMESEPGERVTKTGFVVGTPEYMSPEQLAGDPVNGRSDQYALALVFYRLITEGLPFEGSSMQETLVKRLTDPPRPLAVIRPDLRFPAGLQSVMDRALARQSAARYPSVQEFSDAVNAVVRSDAVPTRPLSAMDAGGRASIPPTRRFPELPPPPPPRRARRLALATGGVAIVAAFAWGLLKATRPTPGTAGAGDSVIQRALPVTGSAETSSTGRPVADTGSHTSSAPSQPAPAPAPPPAPVKQVKAAAAAATVKDSDSTSGAGSPDTLALPEPGHFDSPRTRANAVRRAERLLASELQPRWKRAEAAARLAEAALLYRQDRPMALGLYRRAYALFPLPRYEKMIKQLADSARQ